MSKMRSYSRPDLLELPWLLRFLQPLNFPHKLGVCDRLFGRRLAGANVRWVQTSSSVPWKLDLTNSTHRWIVYGNYEGSAFIKWAKSFLPRDGVVVDSGANIGQILLYLAQWVPKGRVLAFEPGAEQATWLQECVMANALNHVEIITHALGAASAERSLIEAGLPMKHGAQNYVSDGGNTPVRVVTLSDEVAKRRLNRIDLWKLDVEGYEVEALKGAANLLERRVIRALYVEMQESLQAEITALLGKYNYSGHIISERGDLRRVSRFENCGMGLFLPT